MKKVLIVDDEPDILRLIKVRIETAGHQVMTAGNGREALQAIGQDLPDLIITDVLMPEMDGYAFYKELKNNILTADIPVLVLTARGKMRDTFDVVGVDDFIPKPFDGQELLERVGRLLARRKAPDVVVAEQKVLVAGTDNEVIENMVVQLKRAGCQTNLVGRGPEVISQAALFVPNLMLLEAQMFDMATEDVIRVLRRMTEFERTPILVYSYYRISDLAVRICGRRP